MKNNICEYCGEDDFDCVCDGDGQDFMCSECDGTGQSRYGFGPCKNCCGLGMDLDTPTHPQPDER